MDPIAPKPPNDNYHDAPEVLPYSDKQVAPNASEDKQVVGDPQDSSGYVYPQQYTAPQYAAPGENLDATQTKQRRICGLSKRTFIIVAILAAAIIIGAAVGGGVGGALSNKSSPTSSSQTTSSTTSSQTARTTTSQSASVTRSTATTPTISPTTTWPSSAGATPVYGAFSCPGENGTTYTPSNNASASFMKLCDADYPSGVAGANGGEVTDLLAVIATSMDSCIDQCVSQGECKAVAYGANITTALGRGVGGNCFLKNQKGKQVSEDSTGQAEAAYMVE